MTLNHWLLLVYLLAFFGGGMYGIWQRDRAQSADGPKRKLLRFRWQSLAIYAVIWIVLLVYTRMTSD